MTEHKHPSYGVVSFSRCSGNPRLFASPLETHYHYIKLSISNATWIREGSGDRYFAGADGNLIEVSLSTAQFAELLTTMNTMPGTPCTISRLNRQKVPDPPSNMDSEADRIRSDFKDRIQGMADSLRDKRSKFREIVSKKSMTKADREAAMKILDATLQEVEDNAPYFLGTYQEATEKVAQTAKAEIVAFMASVGLGDPSLTESAVPPQLTSGEGSVE